MATTIEIEDMITVGALADKLSIPVTRLIGELMRNGVLVTVNEQIDFDTAQIIVEELGLDMTLQKQQAAERVPAASRAKANGDKDAPVRAPVVAVMGHVDHGKTSLLDAIRGAAVAKGEAGGITQHISAYQIDHNNRKITFLDTPGHEAFAAIREHSAHLTDIAIIVVAADDGVKPQTIEAIRFVKKAGVRMIVAINKMDKEGANPNLIKQQLADQDVLVEEWGGDVVIVEISAKTGKGIPQLMDMILLVSDVEDLHARVDGPASGLIIEAHVEQGRGPVAHALVESGTLLPGVFVVAGHTYAKIRNLESTTGQAIMFGNPSTPVVITGFKALPEFGDEFRVVASEKEARELTEEYANNQSRSKISQGVTSNDLLRLMNRSKEVNELNIVVKADVKGSLTSVIDSVKGLDTPEVAVRIVGSGIGSITETDVYRAATGHAIIYGFNVAIQNNIKQLAAREKVDVRLFNIIYQLIDDVRGDLGKLLIPEMRETELGRLLVRGVFKTTRNEVICGGEVTKGKLEVPALARVYHDKEELGEVEIINLKRGPADTKEVFEGEMCGISFASKHRIDIQEGDRIELFQRVIIARHL
jgi:translation initiation factor IF-2